MADFADRLAALATGAPTLGRPRRAGRYEPTGEADTQVELVVETTDVDGTRIPTRERPPSELSQLSRPDTGPVEPTTDPAPEADRSEGGDRSTGPGRRPAMPPESRPGSDRRQPTPSPPSSDVGRRQIDDEPVRLTAQQPLRVPDSGAISSETARPATSLASPALDDLLKWISDGGPGPTRAESTERLDRQRVGPTSSVEPVQPVPLNQPHATEAASPSASQTPSPKVDPLAVEQTVLDHDPFGSAEPPEPSFTTVVHIGSIEIGSETAARRGESSRNPAPAPTEPLHFAGPTLQQFLGGGR